MKSKKNSNYVVNFFATPVTDYSEVIKSQAKTEFVESDKDND